MVEAYSHSAGPEGPLGRECDKGGQGSGVPCPVPSDLNAFSIHQRERTRWNGLVLEWGCGSINNLNSPHEQWGAKQESMPGTVVNSAC